MEETRIRLIEQICRLPAEHLAKVEKLLNEMKTAKISAPSAIDKDWPHAPLHRLSQHGTFFVTAATLDKQHIFQGPDRLTLLESTLLSLAKQYEIVLEAWAVFSNHYHFVAHTTGKENSLATLLSHLHTTTASEVNRHDGTPERQVWFNYWETQLTFEKSYFARLNYVHQNPVKHGLVKMANQYRWCSAAWFERVATSAQVKTVYSFKTDRLRIDDAYEPI